MKCHVVLWIPTIVYRGFTEAQERSVEKNISDIPNEEFWVRVSLQDNRDILVEAKTEDGAYRDFVTLVREGVSSNGLMSFTYKSTSDDENGFRFTTKEFPTAIYHIIKTFYHVHEFHEDENDSSLPPLVTSHKIDVQTEDNEALVHYLNSYSNVVSNFVEYLQLAIRKARAYKNEMSLNARDLIMGMCLKARGYEVYMDVLYRSRYNTKCRPDNMADRNLRHVACNIESGLRYIRLIEHEYSEYKQQSFVKQTMKDAENSLKSSALSIKVGWGSVIIGVVSLLAAFFISARSTRELKTVKQSLQQQLDSIPALIQDTKRREEDLSRKQEDFAASQADFNTRLEGIERRLNIIIRNQEK